MDDKYLEKYENFDVNIPDDIFISANSSRTVVSVESSSFVKTSYSKSRLDILIPLINAYTVSLKDGYCYVDGHDRNGDGRGFYILDFNDMKKPKIVFYEEGEFMPLVVDGDYVYQTLYVGDSAAYELIVYDVSNKGSPVVVYSEYFESRYKFSVNNQIMLILSLDSSIRVLNFSDISDPFVMGNWVLDEGHEGYDDYNDVVMEGKYTYFATHNGLFIYKMHSNYSSIVSVGKINGNFEWASIAGNFLFSLESDLFRGLVIIDVSNKSNPHIVGNYSIDTLENKARNFINDDYCFLFDQFLYIFDIRDVRNPFLVGRIDYGYNVYDFSIDGDLVLLGSEYGVVIFNVSNVTDPVLVSEFGESYSTSLDVIGDFIYNIPGSFSKGSLKVINIKDISLPWVVGRIDGYDYQLYNQVSVVIIDDNAEFAYLGGASRRFIEIVNISNYKVVSKLSIRYNGYFIEKDSLFVISGFKKGLYIFNISDKSNVTQIGYFAYSLSLNYEMVSFVACRDVVFFNSIEELIIVNTTKKSQITLVGKCSVGKCVDLFVEEDFAYLACESNGLIIVDISNVSIPTIVGQTEVVYAKKVKVYNNFAFVADKQDIRVFDVSDKTKPTISFVENDNIFDPQDFVVDENYVYVADGYYGIKVLRHSLKLEETDEFTCGETTVTIKGNDGSLQSEEIETTFTVYRDDHCNGHGKCSQGFKCLCYSQYEGDNCEKWRCNSIPYNLFGEVCGGRGTCSEPDECDCFTGYYGDSCENNFLFYVVGLPPIIVGSVGLFLIFAFICCCLICVCFLVTGCCVVVFLLSISSCSFLVIKQTIGIRKYSKLKDFDLLLKEQLLDEDTSIAHLRINRSLFEVDYAEIELLGILGEGGSSSIVYKALWKGKVIAFKSFKTRTICQDQVIFDEFEREVQILGSVSHPNILQFLGCCLSSPRVGILMEFCKLGDLSQFLRNRSMKGLKYPIKEKMRLLFEIISAMEFLHSRNIIHRDLKLENVLIDESEHCKITDFGLSRIVESLSQNKTKNIGTSFYIAPELINSKSGKYDEKCDVFSFAMLIFVLITENYFPFGKDVICIEMKISSNPNFRPSKKELLKSLTDEDSTSSHYLWIIDVVERCWDHDSKKRNSFKELLEMFSKDSIGRKIKSEKIEELSDYFVNRSDKTDEKKLEIFRSEDEDKIIVDRVTFMNLQEEVEKLKREIEVLRKQN